VSPNVPVTGHPFDVDPAAMPGRKVAMRPLPGERVRRKTSGP